MKTTKEKLELYEQLKKEIPDVFKNDFELYGWLKESFEYEDPARTKRLNELTLKARGGDDQAVLDLLKEMTYAEQGAAQKQRERKLELFKQLQQDLRGY